MKRSGTPAFSVYSATKAAVRSFARNWTLDLRERKIRVNAVSPGVVPTPGYIVQNGNAYEEGLREFWEPIKAYWQERSPENAEKLKHLFTLEATKWQYTNGVHNLESISPDTWTVDQHLLDRPGNEEIQMALFYSYGTNPPLYPQWQEYFRQYQPPTLIVWGKNDYIFPADGAYPYQRDLKDVEFHLLDTGHFALEEDGDAIANYIDQFLTSRLQSVLT